MTALKRSLFTLNRSHPLGIGFAGLPFNEGVGNPHLIGPCDIEASLVGGVAWIGTGLGYALDFNAVNSRVDVSSCPTIDDIFAGGGTISAWINFDSAGESNSGRIANKNDTAGWIFYLSAGVDIYFLHDFSGGIAYWYADVNLSTNAWHHVTVTYDNSSTGNDPIIYINGAAKAVTEGAAPSGTAESDAGVDLQIGSNSGLNRDYDGEIANLYLWDRILSADEAALLYHNNTAMFQQRRISDWIGAVPQATGWGGLLSDQRNRMVI